MTERLSASALKSIREIVDHPDAWPDVRDRAQKALKWSRGELGYNCLSHRVKTALLDGENPKKVLAGHHPKWCKEPAVRLSDKERQTLQELANYPDPTLPERFQAAQSSHAKLLLSLAERPADWRKPCESKMMRKLNFLSPVEATDPYKRGEAEPSGTSGPLLQSWKPTPDECAEIAKVARLHQTGVLALKPAQARRLAMLTLVASGADREKIIKDTGFSAATVRHILWSCSKRGPSDTIMSSCTKGR